MTEKRKPDWLREWPLIQEAAKREGVDPFFIAAIRGAENGRPGREFGVLSVKAATYDQQLGICCRSVKNGLSRAIAAGIAVDEWYQDADEHHYTTDFIRHFAARWAPENVANDPNQLNNNWVKNVTALYEKFVREGRPT